MKTMSLLAMLVLSLSVYFVAQVGDDKPYERNYSLEGLPVYLKDTSGRAEQASTNEYKLDTTMLEFLIQQSVDPDGWSETGIAIHLTKHQGVDVLRIVQTPLNHEKITELLYKLRKRSPHHIEDSVELVGVKF